MHRSIKKHVPPFLLVFSISCIAAYCSGCSLFKPAQAKIEKQYFADELQWRKIDKNESNYVKCLLALALHFGRRGADTFNWDSLYDDSRRTWTAVIYGNDSDSIVKQTQWPATDQAEAISVGKASWLLSLYDQQYGILVGREMTLDMMVSVFNGNGVIFYETPENYRWIEQVGSPVEQAGSHRDRSWEKNARIPHGRTNVLFSDGTKETCDSKTILGKGGIHNVREWIIVLPRDTMVCPLLDKVVSADVRLNGKFLWSPYVLKEYAKVIRCNSPDTILPQIPQNYPCAVPPKRRSKI